MRRVPQNGQKSPPSLAVCRIPRNHSCRLLSTH